tara:strand:+ start:1610 stop:2137 length:528 start_codon:yes stop_codon:yes gene_type:complete
MKQFLSILFLSILFVGCQEKQNNASNEAFEKNSKTVLANLEGWQHENLDYSNYAENFVMRETGVNGKDSLSLSEVKQNDKELWKNYDFKLLTNPIVLLPGVNVDTKKPDGSVRYYGDWEVTVPATDSTEARSAVLKYYESFDFDANGKIVFQQGYGDFGGLMMQLHGNDADEMEQ